MSSATDSELFESLVENLKESTVASVSDPDSLVDDYLASVVDTKFHTEYEVNAILDDLKYASFKAFYINWLRESKVQILAQGNILKSHVTDLASLVMKHMQFKPVKSVSEWKFDRKQFFNDILIGVLDCLACKGGPTRTNVDRAKL